MTQLNSRFKIKRRKRNNSLHIDKLKHAGDEDVGQTRLEYLFLSLACYIEAIGRIVACQKNLPLRSIDTRVSGKLDMDDPKRRCHNNRVRFPRISVMVRIEADMTQEEKRSFLHDVTERCFISDSFKTLTEISIDPE